MAVVINTNVDSLKIQNCLTNSTNKLSQSMQRLSSGLKINSAKDDAAGTVISARMKVQLNGTKIAQQNVQNGNSMLATAEGNLDVVLDNLTRIRDLTLQAKNGTYSTEEIQAMQDEVLQRIDEIDRISTSAKYSQLSLFNDYKDDDNNIVAPDAATKGIAIKGVTLQVGPNSTEDNTVAADKSIFESVCFSSITDFKTPHDTFDLTKMDSAADADPDTEGSYVYAMNQLDKAIDNITGRKSEIGSVENRLESAYDALTTQYTNLSAAKSVITDADVAAESSIFTQQQILQQVSTSLLTQANQAPSIALSLV